MNLWDFDAIDWDDADDELGNLVHCQLHGVDERVVDQVLRGEPAEGKSQGSDGRMGNTWTCLGGTLWILWFDRSFKRGDWLRPVTGRRAESDEVTAWKKGRGRS